MRLRLKVNEVFRVSEPTGIRSVIRPADFRDYLLGFRERRKNQAGLVHKARAFGKACALRQRTAGPDRAFIQVRQKFRANDSAEAQKKRDQQTSYTDADGDCAMSHAPAQAAPILLGQKGQYWVVRFGNPATKQRARKNRGDQN